jgi:type II secretory pathway pseudopilin PulG
MKKRKVNCLKKKLTFLKRSYNYYFAKYENRFCKFTILELLIIIAIITVLASLLLPSLRQAKKASYVSVCMNYQRQIILNMSIYTQDSNEYFIPYLVNYDGNPWYWTTVLVKKYNVSNMIFLCPERLDFYYGASSSNPVSNQYCWENASKYPAGSTIYFWAHSSYGYNSFYLGEAVPQKYHQL